MTEAAEALMRGRRLQAGKCPDHGKVLVTKEPLVERDEQVGVFYKCPEDKCSFEIAARYGSRLMKLLR